MIRSLLFVAGVLALGPVHGGRAQDKADAKKEESDIEKLAKELRHKDARVRIKAAKGLGEKGGDAAPAARALCDALLDPSPQVAVAALEALEPVRPDLYKPLAAMLLDKDREKHVKAVQELGLMGEKAAPVVNVLLVRLRNELATRNVKRLYNRGLTDFERAAFAAIRQIKPDDPETVKLYKVMAGPANQDGYARLEAILFLTDWAAEDETRRKEVLPLLRAGLDNPTCQAACIKLSGGYGPLAKEFVPLLKKLKLAKDEATRQAAGEALDRIENP
ncbi:---NA--- : : HEAT_2 [Gemmataceae bacterium]|nr:---NA--- : : HEAT_2 [Gemmataceae bacterium]VTU01233.1 ---NA--- : : HEAT_2 [Gemmataceae bacterium]